MAYSVFLDKCQDMLSTVKPATFFLLFHILGICYPILLVFHLLQQVDFVYILVTLSEVCFKYPIDNSECSICLCY